MPNSIPIIEAARSYVTDPPIPFYHAGRDRNGLDCIGLIACVAKDLGYQFKDDRNYRPGVYPKRMLAGIAQFSHEVEPDGRRVGDILVFAHERYPKIPGHLAIYTGETIIHCDARAWLHKVVETSLGRYAKRIHSVWRFKERV